MQNNAVGGSKSNCVYTPTSDNEAATAKAMDLFTNYDGSVRCVVHTIALVVNDVTKPVIEWQKLVNIVNKTTTYFRTHSKANMKFRSDPNVE